MHLFSLREKIGQLFMIGFHGTQLAPEVRTFIEENHIGFVILFSRNIESVSQVRNLTAEIHAVGQPGQQVLIYTDQEGGTIVRFGELAATAISAMGIAATHNPENALVAGRLIGEDMKRLGIDGIFAPVLDVNVEEDNPVIGVRSFSDQPELVSQYALQFSRGLREAGVLACGKHYPGHGAAAADSHLEIPVIPISFQYFKYYCFQPFKEFALQHMDSIMTAHVRFPQIAPDIATFSPYLVRDLLRLETGYNGVVFSDCLEMSAVKDHFSPDQVVLNVMEAGVDVMVPSHSIHYQQELLERLLFYVQKGHIPESRIDESFNRVLALKEACGQRNRQPGTGAREIKLRRSIAVERDMADQSITLLRNHSGILPIDPEKKILLLEWHKTITGPSVKDDHKTSMVEQVSAGFFNRCRTEILDPSECHSLSAGLEKRLRDIEDDVVIAFICSRPGQVGQQQAQAVKRMLKLCPDAIIVSMETPYLIKQFPEANTFLVSYGYRQVQLEALFKVLTGQIIPTGKLPVKIKNIAPRGFGLGTFAGVN